MYAQFDLPGRVYTASYDDVRHELLLSIGAWASKHGITYTTKIVKGKLRVCFPRYEDYTFFAMSFEPECDRIHPDWFRFELIEPMNL